MQLRLIVPLSLWASSVPSLHCIYRPSSHPSAHEGHCLLATPSFRVAGCGRRPPLRLEPGWAAVSRTSGSLRVTASYVRPGTALSCPLRRQCRRPADRSVRRHTARRRRPPPLETGFTTHSSACRAPGRGPQPCSSGRAELRAPGGRYRALVHRHRQCGPAVVKADGRPPRRPSAE